MFRDHGRNVKQNLRHAWTGRQVAEKPRIPGLAERIREVRERWAAERSHIGRQAFSKAAGLSDTSLASYEEGEQEPGAYALMRIAQAGGVSVDYLINGGAHPPTPTPSECVENCLRVLRALPAYREMPRDFQRRYKDFLRYIGVQMRRLTFDAERCLAELHARTRSLRFDDAEFRREWLQGEEEDWGGGEPTGEGPRR
jgi:transcriptional regulator with XRE-family HTH domain